MNPPDGEQVIAVELVDIKDAIKRFAEINRHDIAELYKLAHQMREQKTQKGDCDGIFTLSER